MARRRQKNKLIRYLTVFKRKIKTLNRKKVKLWLKTNFRQHPFILGFLSLVWIDVALMRMFFTNNSIRRIILFHIFIFIAWLALVAVSNLLRDKDRHKVKWYHRKRFVFMMLAILAPLGAIFLWSGSRYKRVTKVILTVIFGSFFIIAQVHYNKKYEKFVHKSPFEKIVEMVGKPKRKVFLKGLSSDVLKSLQVNAPQKGPKVKLVVSEIVLQCSSGVVSIKTKDKYGKDLGLGSGFLISPDGIIVTNFHVMELAYAAEVIVGDENYKEVYFVKGIPSLDIAILKIESRNLPYLNIGDSDSLLNGQFIVVLGSPWGFERSVSNGIISAMRSKGNIKMIQMTAPVSAGSSGGPVINEYGEVVGITTLASSFMAQNLNFAVPIKYLDTLIRPTK